MKTVMWFLVPLMIVFMSRMTYANDPTFSIFRKSLNDALSSRDMRKVITVVESVERSTNWNFGAGIGPHNADSAQCFAVDAVFRAEGSFSDVPGSEAESKWRAAFLTKPSDSISIVRLLKDEKPAIRLIALRKLESEKQLDEAVVKALVSMSESDGYARILPRPPNSTEGHPPPPGMFETDVEYPLRKLARKLLAKFGRDVKHDPERDAMDGIQYFAKHWQENPAHRECIQEAITLLDPNGYGVKAIKKLSAEEECLSAYKIFLKELSRFDCSR